jgi:hypothetical protein
MKEIVKCPRPDCDYKETVHDNGTTAHRTVYNHLQSVHAPYQDGNQDKKTAASTKKRGDR